MEKQSSVEKAVEQLGVGTTLGILAQLMPYTKEALDMSKTGTELVAKAQFSEEPGDTVCPPTALERFLIWLRKHGPHPPIPHDWSRSHIYEISAKPLPPKRELKLSAVETLFYLHQLYAGTIDPETKGVVASAANRFAASFGDEIPFCGTPWHKGSPIGGPR